MEMEKQPAIIESKTNGFQLYCDESGNTGDDFLENNQPIYALTGWIVPSPKISLSKTFEVTINLDVLNPAGPGGPCRLWTRAIQFLDNSRKNAPKELSLG
jgi:hypothetical protein